MTGTNEDVRAIEALIRRQVDSLAWAPGRDADWDGFARGFLAFARLIQSPRPVESRTVPQFVARQQGLAREWLKSYGQRLLGTQVSVFGNVAVALVACEMSENGAAVARNVAALLLVRDDGAWKIAAQTWDRAHAGNALPPALAGGEGGFALTRPDEVRAIEALIRRQFESLAWAPGRDGDWDGFARNFLPGAALLPSARPVRPQTVPQFVARMQGLAREALRTFDERALGMKVSVFGNIAVALAACEMTENGTTVSCNVEALLLVRDVGAWKIAAQGWDRAGAEHPLPPALSGTA